MKDYFNYTPKYQNIFKNVTIYRLYITQNDDNGLPLMYQVFENNDRDKVEQVKSDYEKIKYFQNVTYSITEEVIFHETIEDAYYTYSHIFETGEVLNFSLYTMMSSPNIAEIISKWFELIVYYQTQVSHFHVEHIAYANNETGTLDFTFDYDIKNPSKYYGTYSDQLIHSTKNPEKYTWVLIEDDVPITTKTEFSFHVSVKTRLEQVIGNPEAINKRDRRYDKWQYKENEDYKFIGGYES